MKRRKHKQDANDSFELFLDTITNTFGGVLLIALLIVLMIRESKESAPEISRSGPTESSELVQTQLLELNSNKERILQELATLKSFQKGFQTAELKTLASDLSQIIFKNHDLETNLNLLKQKFAKLSNQTKQAEADLRNYELALSQKKQRQQQLKEELEKEEALRTRTMILPKERTTRKEEVAMFVESNELYVLITKSSVYSKINAAHFGSASIFNADVNVSGSYYKVKAGNGIALTSNSVQRELEKYSTTKYFFTFVVRSDSFDSFGFLRKHCVKNGHEYRIIPSDGMIGEGSGTKVKTQRP